MSLEACACDDLLILDWSCPEGLQPGIGIRIDDEAVEKPVLGAQWVEMPRYLLVARHRGISRRSHPVIQLVDAAGQMLARYTVPRLPRLSAAFFAACSLPTRIRMEKVLLSHLPSRFAHLEPATFNRLVTCLAPPLVRLSRCPDGSLYVRIPWVTSAEPGLVNFTLRSARLPLESQTISTGKALTEGGYLHGLIADPESVFDSARHGLLEVDGVRRTVLRISKWPKAAAGQSRAQWMDARLRAYSGNTAALKAFLLLQRGSAHASRTRLNGWLAGVQGGVLKGGAWNPDQPDQVLDLEILVDDQVVARVKANLPHPARADDAPVNCGFVHLLDTVGLGDGTHTLTIREATSGKILPGGRLLWGPGHFDGEFSLQARGTLRGWVAERCHAIHALRVRFEVDGIVQAETLARPEVSGQRACFEWPLPDLVFDTALHRITVAVKPALADEWVKLSQGIGVKTTYQGHLDSISPTRVSGWIVNRTAPERPVSLELRLGGRTVAHGRTHILRSDVQEKPGHYGFEFSLADRDQTINAPLMRLHLAGTSVEVLGPAILMTPYEVALQALAQAAAVLNPLTDAPESSLWVRSQVLAGLQTELRRAKTFPARITLDLGSLVQMPVYSAPDPVVAVIVPVYGNRDGTLACIHSVLDARTEIPFELVVIDDASPEAELREALRDLAARQRLTLLENPVNQGFVASVNRGMQHQAGRDVVLLNSDTLVAAGWLDRLHAAAVREASTGTVTPLSNNATICTIAVPEGMDMATLDGLCARVNAGVTVDIPTAVGFCMYIKRRVLDEVGYFNQALWDKGYAEENDFCLRASTLGWRHQAAADVFVWHEGGCSFGDSKDARILTNLDKLNRIYPDYAPLIARFEARDPLAPVRNRILREWLKQHSDRYVLFVIHGLGGGTQVAADTLARSLAEAGYPVLQLMSKSPTHWQMSVSGLPCSLEYLTREHHRQLLDDLRYLGVWHIHYHQTMQFPLAIWDLPEALGVPYDISLHDYLPLCPRINLIGESGYYCEDAQYQPDICHRCLALNGFDEEVSNDLLLRNKFAEFGQDIRTWRAHYARILAGARRVIAPSQAAADIFRSHFAELPVRVIPHPEVADSSSAPLLARQPGQVVVIGAIGRHKGYDILLGCVRQAAVQGLALHFTVIGYTRDDATLLQYPNVSITGPYEAGELAERVAASQAGVALFLSPWPETYCFTLSEAWQQGLYPVALDIGAVAERIRASGQGLLLPLHATAGVINRTLLQSFASELPVVTPAPDNGAEVVQSHYGWPAPEQAAIKAIDPSQRQNHDQAG
jgi:GT2 family glycosyltransferase/glycosyltransferase involved in cell wall biosynthesis